MSGWTDDNRRAGQPHQLCDTISAVDHAFRTSAPTNGCLELVDLPRIELVVGPSSGCSGRLGGGDLDRYGDLFDDDLDIVADRFDVVARTAREFLADCLRTDSPHVYLWAPTSPRDEDC